ncbi:MAG: DUF5995 family protein [Pleurocapsa sp. MO_226.B13]|nr:DUF5995 family protein [Pleurocapsa sp. MO_226.B13]
MEANNIEEVIQGLDTIIARAKETNSRVGFFAALYRQVTLKIDRRISEGRFDNNVRMNEFATRFANRYFDALAAYRQGDKLPKAWKVTLEATEQTDLIIVQHLLLGINAHVNFDLGIATAQTSPGNELASLRNDFNQLNEILADLLDEVQEVIGEFSPWMDILDRVGGRKDESIANFSITKARKSAWEQAEILAYQTPLQQQAILAVIDSKVAFLGRIIANPSQILRLAIQLIKSAERDDVPAIVDAINSIVQP